MRRQKSIIHQPQPMQLPVQLQHRLRRLRDLQAHELLVLLQLLVQRARALDVLARRSAQLLRQRRGDGQRLPVQHDDALPVVEVEEERVEADACLGLRGRFGFPFAEAAVDVCAPVAEGGEVLEERRGEVRVHELVGLIGALRARLLCLAVLKDLEDLGLEESEAEVVVCDELRGRRAVF